MSALGVAIVVWMLSAVAALGARRWRGAPLLGAAGAVLGGVAAAIAAIGALGASGAAGARAVELWSVSWTLPAGALAFRLDALAAVFLLPVAIIGALCAVYSVAYLRAHAHGRPAGGAFAAYNLLLASMAIVVAADDMLLLLFAWELMTLSSWALVVSDHEARSVRAAGMLYLVAGQLATVALLLLVTLLAGTSGTFAISGLALPAAMVARSAPAWLLFLLALIAFGTKAGIVPFHVWLPDAHSAAPSHVSALMSAVMITMGFYGLARFVPLLGEPAAWWGYLLMTLGAAGATGGIALGLAQRDVKRTLAYSTVENAGIITLAMGVGVIATALHEPVLAGLAWTAALLHLWNHALAKTLLFLGFGAVAQGVGSRSLDSMGGLLRRWRVVGGSLVLGAAAIAALPGLNLFTSEWLLLRGLFAGAIALHGVAQVSLLGGVVVLALTGGIAVATFTRLVGLGLLGKPRSAAAESAPEPGWTMRVPLIACAAGCVAVAAVPARVSAGLAGAVHVVAPTADAGLAVGVLQPLVLVLPILVVAAIVLLALRGVMLRPALRRTAGTWGCGYPDPAPTARMQYTSTSYGEPLLAVFAPVVGVRTVRLAHSFETHPSDPVLTGGVRPAWHLLRRLADRLRPIQRGRLSSYLLYLVAAVLALLLYLLFYGGAR